MTNIKINNDRHPLFNVLWRLDFKIILFNNYLNVKKIFVICVTYNSKDQLVFYININLFPIIQDRSCIISSIYFPKEDYLTRFS